MLKNISKIWFSGIDSQSFSFVGHKFSIGLRSGAFRWCGPLQIKLRHMWSMTNSVCCCFKKCFINKVLWHGIKHSQFRIWGVSWPWMENIIFPSLGYHFCLGTQWSIIGPIYCGQSSKSRSPQTFISLVLWWHRNGSPSIRSGPS